MNSRLGACYLNGSMYVNYRQLNRQCFFVVGVYVFLVAALLMLTRSVSTCIGYLERVFSGRRSYLSTKVH